MKFDTTLGIFYSLVKYLFRYWIHIQSWNEQDEVPKGKLFPQQCVPNLHRLLIPNENVTRQIGSDPAIHLEKKKIR